MCEEDGAPCNAGDSFLCWPSDRRKITDDYLSRWYHGESDHRDRNSLESVCNTLSEELGEGRQCYILGIKPLIIAYEEPDASINQEPFYVRRFSEFVHTFTSLRFPVPGAQLELREI